MSKAPVKLSPAAFRKLFPGASADTIRENIGGTGAIELNSTPPKAIRRIRQDHKPLMNRLEQAWFDNLKSWAADRDFDIQGIRAQAIRVRISNGAWFRADCSAIINQRLTFFECKGPSGMKNVDRGILALKVAASTYPEFDWYLVWKDNGKLTGQWVAQQVLP